MHRQEGERQLMERRKEMLCQALEHKARAAVSVSSMELAVGGNSRESWIADVRIGSEALKLVLRCDPDGWIRPTEMRREINGLRFAERAGVAAPRVIICSDELDLGRPFVVVNYVAGTAIARYSSGSIPTRRSPCGSTRCSRSRRSRGGARTHRLGDSPVSRPDSSDR